VLRFGLGELIIVVVVALFLFGADRLWGLSRKMGKLFGGIKKEVRDLKKFVNDNESEPS